MERDRLRELARRRDAAVRRILDFQRRAAEFRAAEELVGALEAYAGSLPAEDPAEETWIREWRGANLAAMRVLADCERVRNRDVTAAHDIRVVDGPGGERIADVSVLLSVDRARDEGGREDRRPFRVVVECLGATTLIRTEAVGEAGPAEQPAQTAGAEDPGTTRTASCQADLPIPYLYGGTDPLVHQRTKFRPDRIDPYGLPIGVSSPAGSPRSSHGAESVGCQSDPVPVAADEDFGRALLGDRSPAPSEPGAAGLTREDARPDPPPATAVKAVSREREPNSRNYCGDEEAAPGGPRRRPVGEAARSGRSGFRRSSGGATEDAEHREANRRNRNRSRSTSGAAPPAGTPDERGSPAAGAARGPGNRPPTPGGGLRRGEPRQGGN